MSTLIPSYGLSRLYCSTGDVRGAQCRIWPADRGTKRPRAGPKPFKVDPAPRSWAGAPSATATDHAAELDDAGRGDRHRDDGAGDAGDQHGQGERDLAGHPQEVDLDAR